MKAAPFEYRRPESVDQAIELVAGCDGFAKLIAGGQTLGPMMNLRLVQPDRVVDISRLEELRQVSEETGRIRIGSAVTHAMIEDGLVPDLDGGLFKQVASGIAYRSIRNRGTIGGSLAHADPSAEWPTILLALEASVRLRGAAGSRELPVAEMLVGAMTTSLADDEVIEAVLVPRPRRLVWGFRKLCRKVGEFAHSLALVVRDPDARGCHAVLGGLGRAPLMLPRCNEVIGAASEWRSALSQAITAACRADLADAAPNLDEDESDLHAINLQRAAKEALTR